jgi:tRNA-Thr(GGU) m(6)t(6)A37 methyltransferase TsaA
MFLRRRKLDAHREPFAGLITLVPVAHVVNGIATPRPHGWERVESAIVFAPEHVARLAGLDRYSHVLVVFYLDIAADAPEKPEQLTLASGNTYGIFATRSQLRPNHLGVSAVPLLGVEAATVRVRGLDAIDGTAVLDIKPYLPEYDAIPGAPIPGER